MDGAAGMTRDSDSADGAAVEYGSDELELQVPPNAELPDHSLEQVIVRRGSSRAFARAPITAGQLAVVLDRCQPPISTDYQSTPGLVQPYLIANAVDGLAGGIYQVLGRQPVRLRQIRSGEYRTVAAQLALGQALGGDAAVNLYFMSPLEQVLERFGERGYRIAQMEAAIAAGRGYLAAYALGIGATGLTFFDELVEQLLDVTDQHLKVMFLLAVGVPFNR